MSLNLDEIEDMGELFKIMTSLDLQPTGCKTLDQMKGKINEHLKHLGGSSTRKVGETYQVLSQAVKSDAEKRENLLDLYVRTEQFMAQLDSGFVKTLQTSLGDFNTALKENIKNVKPRDQYIVLVAGETSSGKSSVINLILGEDLLPHKTLSTTSTICELKYGEKPKIGVHFKDTGTETREPKFHELVTDGEETYKEQIEKFVHLKNEDREKKPYKKIELFWPHPLFKEGVMIVDSPGIGESEDMSEFVLSYLPHAFCFMYVINSANAGGIQDDRLLKILGCAQTLKKNAKMDLALFTRCALFVANMWDRIDCTEREEVKKAQIEKLTKKLGNLNPRSQIVYLSCKNAQIAQTYGVITEDFNDLITGISNLVVSSMHNNLLMYSRWLEDHLAFVSRQIRVFLKAAKMSHQQTEEKINRVLSRMKELQISQQRRFDELSEHQSQRLQKILGKLAAHFTCQETIKRFCKWSLDEVPPALETWKETKGEALKYVSERTHQFVQQWEDDNNEFAKAQAELIKFCFEKYYVMEKELRKVEDGAFIDDNQVDVQEDQEPTSKSLKTSAPIWLRQGLASVVVGSPRVLSRLSSKLKKMAHYKTKLESYSDDPCEYMSRKSNKCLKAIATQDRLLPFINEQLEDAVQFLRQIKEKIPKLMEGDEQLYHQLLDDQRSKTEIQEVYEPLSQQIEWLKSSLIVYILGGVAKSEFKKGELKCDERWDSIVGSGTSSTVYKGVLAREGNPVIEVALKRYKDPLTTYNVSYFVEEERALRHLKHPSIVTFYGVDLRRGPHGTTVIIVLELCDCSLRSQVMSQPENAPARFPNEAVQMKALSWAQDILAALRYIHSEGFVHRDLNLDNILLTHDGRVKLADVGVAKHEKDITGTFCGTPLYLAPEVYSGQIYNSKADMYSFGFLLWELWYGERIFQAAPATKPVSALLEDMLKRELRPPHIEGTSLPWEIWRNVMMSCWSKEPRERLTAQRGWECLEELQVLGRNQELALPLPPRSTSAPQGLSQRNKPPVKPKPASPS